jgi:phosphatidylinositol-3-phosphatase
MGPCLFLVLLAGVAGCGRGVAPITTTSTGSPPSTSPTATSRVAIVVLENLSYGSVIGNPAAPYLNQLTSQDSLATDYFADTHPSIGNYFMMTTGQIVTNDDSFGGTVSADNLAREITGVGKSWKVYAQSLPSVGYTGGDQYPYFRHHNPFAYFSDVLNSPSQADNMVPAAQLSADLASGALPNFLFIVPDAQHDAHDCPAGMNICTDNDKLSAADAWVQQNVGPLVSSSAFSNGVVVVVFDESVLTDLNNGGGHVAAILAGGAVKTAFQSGSFHQHQNLLRFVCDRLSLGACPGIGAAAGSMSEFLKP